MKKGNWKNDVPVSKERLDWVRNLVTQTAGISITVLDNYVPGVSRAITRPYTKTAAGKFAKAIWLLHERLKPASGKRHAVTELLRELAHELNDKKPLPQNTQFVDFRKLFVQWLFPAPAALSDEGLLQLFYPYLGGEVESCSQLVTRGINLGPGTNPLRLAPVYVNLDTKSRHLSSLSETAHSAESAKVADVLDVVFDSKLRHVVLVGEPGSGKSTCFQYMLLCLAHCQARQHAEAVHLAGLAAKVPATLQNEKVIPFRVTLREFASSLGTGEAAGSADNVRQFLKQHVKALGYAKAAEKLGEVLERGLALVLFDGLDEVPKAQVNVVQNAITTFAQGAYRKCRIAVTCRTVSYRTPEFKLAGFPPPHEIAPLTSEQRMEFVRAWYKELAHSQPQFRNQEADACATTLIAALTSDTLREMSGNPFFLTVMASLHRPDKPLPGTSALLMHELVNSVLEESRRAQIGSDKPASSSEPELVALLKPLGTDGLKIFRLCLEKIAYRAREKRRGKNGRLIDDDILQAGFPFEDKVKTSDLLDALRHRAGLLLSPDGRKFEFAYRFEEFLAGCHLAKRDAWTDQGELSHFHRRALKLLDDHGEYARQTVLWAAGFNAHVQSGEQSAVRELVWALVPEHPATAKPDAIVRLEMAADITHDSRMKDWLEYLVPNKTATFDRLRRALEQVRNDKTKSWDVKVRSQAASSLGRLGDHRPGIGVASDGRPDIEWILIPSGEFVMGGTDVGQGNRIMQHCKLIASPYRISRYPVTVAQYECFVKAGGYTNQDLLRTCWTNAGRLWLDAQSELHPVNYDAVFQTPNHPRVGVAWLEAVAFSRWLSIECKMDIRLPSEPEWERAARGIGGRVYPWGSEADFSRRCNMERTGIGHTSTVGLFPLGDTPGEQTREGVADLAGNVWEWCRTLWLKDYNGYELEVSDDPEANGNRVLRGGSWLNADRLSLSSSCRYHDPPDFSGPHIGFRLICVECK